MCLCTKLDRTCVVVQCDVLSFMVEGATVFRIVIEVKVEAARKYVIIRTPLEVRAALIPVLHERIENYRFPCATGAQLDQ